MPCTQRTISTDEVVSVETYEGSASFNRWLATVVAEISELRIPYLTAPWAYRISVVAAFFARSGESFETPFSTKKHRVL